MVQYWNLYRDKPVCVRSVSSLVCFDNSEKADDAIDQEEFVEADKRITEIGNLEDLDNN